MRNLAPKILFALLLSPVTASAQTIAVPDPEPASIGCQNIEVARHADGDIVMVDYHGQWLDHADGQRSQNGGPNGAGCATERIARFDQNGNLSWELQAGEASAAELLPSDRVRDLRAMPDGSTVISVSEGTFDDDQRLSILLVEPDGSLRWRIDSVRAPRFAMARAFVGESGELFMNLDSTNYGYEGGVLQLPGGRAWKLRKSVAKQVVARIDPTNGDLLWERENAELISTREGELIMTHATLEKGSPFRISFSVERRSYAGALISKGRTPRLTSEMPISFARRGDELWMTTADEALVPGGGRVKERKSRLRVFDLAGRELHTRGLSDGSKLAIGSADEPVHIVSPTECERGKVDRFCATRFLQVLRLDSWREDGVTTQIGFGRSYISNSDFRAESAGHKVLVSAKTFRPSTHGTMEPVTVVQVSSEAERRPAREPSLFVWQPLPPKKSSTHGTDALRIAF